MRVTALVTASALFSAALSGQEPARLPVSSRTAPDSLVGFDGRVQDAERVTLAIRHPRARDTVELEVVYLRLPARRPTTSAPIVFLMGGPGVPASVIGRVPPYWSLFERLRDVADVILLDQRGVGLSRPALECSAGAAPPAAFLRSQGDLAEALRTAFAGCVDEWRARGVPAELFSTAAIAADLEAIRLHLDVPRVSLLGFSFGTRLALEYVRLYPNAVDRVVLQGTLGFADGVRLPAVLDSLLDRVGAAAARDSVGRTLAPDLRSALRDRLEAVERQPVEVTLARPASGPGPDSVRLTVGRGGLEALVQGRLADRRLPALVASLAAGDTRVLAAMAGGIQRDLAAGGGSMFGRSVYCSSPGPEPREREARRQAPRYLLGEVFDNVPTSVEFCRGIGIRPGPRARPPSGVVAGSALFITGTLDDRTPPGNAERARRWFRTSQAVVVENGGHELLPSEDVQALVIEFLGAGRVGVERLAWPPPRFATVEEAIQPPRRP